jgi:anti-sigma factor RsiW
MSCSEVRACIQLYLDGRLETQRVPRLARHLAACGACRDELAAYQMLVEGMTVAVHLQNPDALTASIMRRVRQAEAQLRVPRQRRAFALGWADALIASLLATMMTIIFLVSEPVLRASVSRALSLTYSSLTHGITLATASWSPLLVWLVWIGVGVALTLWFAGREVRDDWRRTVMTRLPH